MVMIMRFTTDVRSTIKQPAEERNAQHVYIRCNYRKATVPEEDGGERIEWRYDEYYMTDNEYENIRAGRLFGIDGWSDALRAVERSARYRIADDMIAKYTSDVPDDAKRDMWVQYKHAVRETQNAPGYPQQVTYPEEPE